MSEEIISRQCSAPAVVSEALQWPQDKLLDGGRSLANTECFSSPGPSYNAPSSTRCRVRAREGKRSSLEYEKRRCVPCLSDRLGIPSFDMATTVPDCDVDPAIRLLLWDINRSRG